MIGAKRRARILELLQERGVISVGELEWERKASGMTIRRDLTALDATGQVRRTRACGHRASAPPVLRVASAPPLPPCAPTRVPVLVHNRWNIAPAAALLGPSNHVSISGRGGAQLFPNRLDQF